MRYVCKNPRGGGGTKPLSAHRLLKHQLKLFLVFLSAVLPTGIEVCFHKIPQRNILSAVLCSPIDIF